MLYSNHDAYFSLSLFTIERNRFHFISVHPDCTHHHRRPRTGHTHQMRERHNSLAHLGHSEEVPEEADYKDNVEVDHLAQEA